MDCMCMPPCCRPGYPYSHFGGGGGGSSQRSGMRTLGPFAESMGLSSAAVMWICVAQLPVIMAMALHYPTVRIDMFSTSIRTALDPADNSTMAIASDSRTAVLVSSYDHGVSITGLYVVNAAAVTFFSVLCMNMLDRGIAISSAASGLGGGDGEGGGWSSGFSRVSTNMIGAEEFVTQNVLMVVDPTFRTWNQAFSALILLTHVTYMATMCSPVCTESIATYALIVYVSIVPMVQPLDNYCSEQSMQAIANSDNESLGAAAGMLNAIASQTNMLRAMAYVVSFGYVLAHTPLDNGACKAQMLLVLACLDALMLYGHLWDRVPSLQVVLNCRFLYACLISLFNMAVFLLWSMYLANPFIVQKH